ncbi:cobalt-precorrin-6A reductase [Swaminathania salitolerans]|uniref:Precorrin-6A reductase n=1 Tax=Swaminathania salitolerans TaxID=182838 RepID=A0A511BMW2_9PROT|nr:cobalt-precorrin-6A reductase [Swaminathania salitolerans]GBQ09387.1 precorrin 6x reductase [Swaminathania salitolerans LMG 21291]GEL00994.1 precorrin-6A reductase [Swaminathania salitolerans]
MNILILGGTPEARLLCNALANIPDIHITFSFAGVTPALHPPGATVRTGGFGGADGLRAFLEAQAIHAVIDATHPFAARMSGNAVAAARLASCPLLRMVRPPWPDPPGRNWHHVPEIAAVPDALGSRPRRVFLSTGRKETAPFLDTPHAYLLRCIVSPDTLLPPHIRILQARGPFSPESERALFRDERIDCLVTKNAGGMAVSAKLEAARDLGIDVIMIDRPPLPPAQECHTIGDALIWIQDTLRAV